MTTFNSLMKSGNGGQSTDVFKGVSNIFDELFRNELMTRDLTGFVPAVNISEDEDNYLVEICAPGYSKEDIKVEMSEHMLTISAETKQEKTDEDKNKKFYRREFNYGSFKRTLSLPESVNEDDIRARYEDGVLKLELPKKEDSKPKPSREISID